MAAVFCSAGLQTGCCAGVHARTWNLCFAICGTSYKLDHIISSRHNFLLDKRLPKEKYIEYVR